MCTKKVSRICVRTLNESTRINEVSDMRKMLRQCVRYFMHFIYISIFLLFVAFQALVSVRFHAGESQIKTLCAYCFLCCVFFQRKNIRFALIGYRTVWGRAALMLQMFEVSRRRRCESASGHKKNSFNVIVNIYLALI